MSIISNFINLLGVIGFQNKKWEQVYFQQI